MQRNTTATADFLIEKYKAACSWVTKKSTGQPLCFEGNTLKYPKKRRPDKDQVRLDGSKNSVAGKDQGRLQLNKATPKKPTKTDSSFDFGADYKRKVQEAKNKYWKPKSQVDKDIAASIGSDKREDIDGVKQALETVYQMEQERVKGHNDRFQIVSNLLGSARTRGFASAGKTLDLGESRKGEMATDSVMRNLPAGFLTPGQEEQELSELLSAGTIKPKLKSQLVGEAAELWEREKKSNIPAPKQVDRAPVGAFGDDFFAATSRAADYLIEKYAFDESKHPRDENGRFTEIDPNKVETLNGIEDSEKHKKLVDSMRQGGWQGRPVAVAGGHRGSEFDGLTGSHRTIAARDAGIDIPAIELDANELAEIEVDGEDLLTVLTQSPYDDEDKLNILKSALPDHPELQELHDLFEEEVDSNLDEFSVPDPQPKRYAQNAHQIDRYAFDESKHPRDSNGQFTITQSRPARRNDSFDDEFEFKTDGGRMGVAKSKWAPTDWSVTDTLTDEDKRGKGIASALIKKAKDNLDGTIGAQTSSDASTRLFWKHGFRLPSGGSLEDAYAKRASESSVNLIYDPSQQEAKPDAQNALFGSGKYIPKRYDDDDKKELGVETKKVVESQNDLFDVGRKEPEAKAKPKAGNLPGQKSLFAMYYDDLVLRIKHGISNDDWTVEKFAKQLGLFGDSSKDTGALASQSRLFDTFTGKAKATSKAATAKPAKKKDDGRWVTIHGTHVFIDGKGTIKKGPDHFVGKKPSEINKDTKYKLPAKKAEPKQPEPAEQKKPQHIDQFNQEGQDVLYTGDPKRGEQKAKVFGDPNNKTWTGSTSESGEKVMAIKVQTPDGRVHMASGGQLKPAVNRDVEKPTVGAHRQNIDAVHQWMNSYKSAANDGERKSEIESVKSALSRLEENPAPPRSNANDKARRQTAIEAAKKLIDEHDAKPTGGNEAKTDDGPKADADASPKTGWETDGKPTVGEIKAAVEGVRKTGNTWVFDDDKHPGIWKTKYEAVAAKLRERRALAAKEKGLEAGDWPSWNGNFRDIATEKQIRDWFPEKEVPKVLKDPISMTDLIDKINKKNEPEGGWKDEHKVPIASQRATGPKEGDRDENGLVFRNGRWRREDQGKNVKVSELRDKMSELRSAASDLKSAVGDKETSRAQGHVDRIAGELAGMTSKTANDRDRERMQSMLDEVGHKGPRLGFTKRKWEKTVGEARDEDTSIGKMERSDGTGQKGLIDRSNKLRRDQEEAISSAHERGENVPDKVLESAGIKKTEKGKAEWDSEKGTSMSLDKGFNFWKDGIPYNHTTSAKKSNVELAAEHLKENGGDKVSLQFDHGGDGKLAKSYMKRVEKLAEAAGYDVGEEKMRTVKGYDHDNSSVVTLTKKDGSKAAVPEFDDVRDGLKHLSEANARGDKAAAKAINARIDELKGGSKIEPRKPIKQVYDEAKDKAKSAAKTVDGPKEGDRDENGLVFRDGRWRREDSESKTEKPRKLTKDEKLNRRMFGPRDDDPKASGNPFKIGTLARNAKDGELVTPDEIKKGMSDKTGVFDKDSGYRLNATEEQIKEQSEILRGSRLKHDAIASQFESKSEDIKSQIASKLAEEQTVRAIGKRVQASDIDAAKKYFDKAKSLSSDADKLVAEHQKEEAFLKASENRQKRKPDAGAKAEPPKDTSKDHRGNEYAPGVTPDIIPRSTAYNAHAGTSHTPERRAETRQKEFAATMNSDYQELKAAAKGDENKLKTLEEQWPNYLDRAKSNYISALNADSRTMSPMITGPARFPVSSNNKKMDTASKRWDEYHEGLKKGMKSIKNQMSPEDAPIKIGDKGVGSHIEKKVKELQAFQDKMKTANAIVRKHVDFKKTSKWSGDVFFKDGKSTESLVSALKDAGIDEDQAKKLARRDPYSNAVGYPSFSLTNNNANLKRYKDQLKAQQRHEAEAESVAKETGGDRVKSHSFEGGNVELDYDDNRLRIKHDEKPSKEVIQNLKRRGFRWSRANGAWQRQLTQNAKSDAKQILGIDFDKEKSSVSVATHFTERFSIKDFYNQRLNEAMEKRKLIRK